MTLKQKTDQINELNQKIKEIELPIGVIISVAIGTKLNTEYFRKLDIEKGFTLVSGNTNGITSGEVKKHNHISQPKIKSGIYGDILTLDKGPISPNNIFNSSFLTSSTGGENNLPAGRYVEFWEKIK